MRAIMVDVPVVPLPPELAARLGDRLGRVVGAHALGGSAFMVQVGTDRVVAKVGPGALDEAAGLRRIEAVPGAPPVPGIVLVEPDLLVTEAVAMAVRGAAHDEALGRSLAALHSSELDAWGGGSSYIGQCRIDPTTHEDAAGFYGTRLAALAARCGLERSVDAVMARLPDLLPPGGPAQLHGDLWWGNVLFGADGRSWLIDPSDHAGHPEEDLAMLALFGNVPERLFNVYFDERPLGEGWEDRVDLFQLYPLLVHAVLFGGTYVGRADAVARRYS